MARQFSTSNAVHPNAIEIGLGWRGNLPIRQQGRNLAATIRVAITAAISEANTDHLAFLVLREPCAIYSKQNRAFDKLAGTQ